MALSSLSSLLAQRRWEVRRRPRAAALHARPGPRPCAALSHLRPPLLGRVPAAEASLAFSLRTWPCLGHPGRARTLPAFANSFLILVCFRPPSQATSGQRPERPHSKYFIIDIGITTHHISTSHAPSVRATPFAPACPQDPLSHGPCLTRGLCRGCAQAAFLVGLAAARRRR